ncbi:ribonuclease H-like domain, reverse transcriptase, RNA-dependent DNA polymerase [Tanacetum coccineum]
MMEDDTVDAFMAKLNGYATKSKELGKTLDESLLEQGIDFDEVFAPVARIETVRFIQQGNSGKVYKLTKALYGLRQAPRAWNVKLDQTLKSLDFKKCNLEQAVYTKRSKTSTLIVGVYIDDLIITVVVSWAKEGNRLKQPTCNLIMVSQKFMATTGAASKLLWLKRLLSEITGWDEERITLKVDNISAITRLPGTRFFMEEWKQDRRSIAFIRFVNRKNGHIKM